MLRTPVIAILLACLVSNHTKAGPLRIMPLGDSITEGSSVGDLTPGGYRTTLYNLLDAAGYDFDFVGSQSTNPGPIPDNDHEGHGGYTLENIRGVMGGPLTTYQPGVVLLLGGTNDVTWSLYGGIGLTAEGIAARLDQVLSDIHLLRPTATVLVGTIPPAAASEPDHSALSAIVNGLFSDAVTAQATLGRDVHLVDIRAALTSADLADSLHPSPTGYAKMGQAWYDAISSLIPPPPPPPVIAWANASGGLFSMGTNWTGSAAPTAIQAALFDLSSTYTVTFDADQTNKRLLVSNDDVTLDLGGHLHILTETTEVSVVVGEASGDLGKLTVTNGALSGSSGAIGIADGSSGQVIVTTGGAWTDTGEVTVGGGTGLLHIQPGGSVAVATALNVNAGGSVNLEGGTITSPSVTVAGGAIQLNGGALNLSGGSLSVTNAGTLTGAFTVDGGASVTISGNGSTWTGAGDLRVGDAGSGTLAIVAGGSVAATSATIGREVGSSGVVTVGAAGAALNVSGPLYVGGSGAAAGGTGSVNVTSGGSMSVGGALKIWPGGSITATAGSLNFDLDQLQVAGGTLTVPTINFTGHNLSGFGTIQANVSGTGSITAAGGDLTIGNLNSYSGFTFSGTLAFGSNTLALLSKGFIDLGSLTTLEGGTLAAPKGLFLAGSRNVVGFGAINAPLAAALGSTIEATGSLALGSPTAFDGFVTDGRLVVNNHTVTIHDRDFGTLGSLTMLGNDDGPGALAAPNGLYLPKHKTLVGYGTVNGPFDNDGRVQSEGPNSTDKIEFTGLVTGSGDFGGTVLFSGGYSPGNSPAEVSAENLILGAANVLTIEIGGLMAGSQYDVLNVSGTIALAGSLDVRLINGVATALGDVFTVLTFGSRTGDFESYSGLDVGNHLALHPLWSETDLTLKALPAIDGDVNLDGAVDIFDVNLVSDHWGEAGPVADANGDGNVDIFDVNLISTNWTAGEVSVTAVPEPSGLLLALVAVVCWLVVVSNRYFVVERIDRLRLRQRLSNPKAATADST